MKNTELNRIRELSDTELECVCGGDFWDSVWGIAETAWNGIKKGYEWVQQKSEELPIVEDIVDFILG